MIRWVTQAGTSSVRLNLWYEIALLRTLTSRGFSFYSCSFTRFAIQCPRMTAIGGTRIGLNASGETLGNPGKNTTFCELFHSAFIYFWGYFKPSGLSDSFHFKNLLLLECATFNSEAFEEICQKTLELAGVIIQGLLRGCCQVLNLKFTNPWQVSKTFFGIRHFKDKTLESWICLCKKYQNISLEYLDFYGWKNYSFSSILYKSSISLSFIYLK